MIYKATDFYGKMIPDSYDLWFLECMISKVNPSYISPSWPWNSIKAISFSINFHLARIVLSWIPEWMNEWMNKRMNKGMVELMIEWIQERTNEWLNEWLNE